MHCSEAKCSEKKLRSFHLGPRAGCSEDSPFCSLGELRVQCGCSPSLADLGTGLFQHTQGWSELWRQIQPDSTHVKPMYKLEGQFILDNTHIMISILTFCRNKNMRSLLIKCSFKMEKQTKGIFFFFFPQTRLSHIAEIPSVLEECLDFRIQSPSPLDRQHTCAQLSFLSITVFFLSCFLEQYYSVCGLQASSISFTRKTVRNIAWALP